MNKCSTKNLARPLVEREPRRKALEKNQNSASTASKPERQARKPTPYWSRIG